MLGALLQEWLTLQGGAGTSIAQSPDGYLDTSYLQDLVFWIDTGSATTSPNIVFTFETAPLKESSLFTAMVTAITPASGTLTSVVVTGQDAIVPPALWTRWKVSSASAWTITFRIWVSANDVRP